MPKVLKLRKEVPASWEEVLQQYLWFKQAEGLKESTIKGQEDIIKIFFSRHPEGYTEPKAAVLAFMAEKIKPATYNIRLSYLKSFFNWCIKEGIYPQNPLEGFKKRKAEGRKVHLDIETLQQLIALPDKKSYAGLRDYALILLTLDTGIRPKEAFSLLPEDVNYRSLEVYVRSEVSKTKVSRTLPISPVTAQAIRELVKYRHSDWKDTISILCSADGTSLNRNTWGDRLELYSKRLGIKVRPYDLRHAFALQFLRNGGHALALQRTLGHTDLSMTKRYVALTDYDIQQQHSLASPLNSILPQKHRVRKT